MCTVSVCLKFAAAKKVAAEEAAKLAAEARKKDEEGMEKVVGSWGVTEAICSHARGQSLKRWKVVSHGYRQYWHLGLSIQLRHPG